MNVFVNDNMFRVRVCVTPETIQKGMMGQRFNSDFNGMLFMMGQNEEQNFWMKNCLIPLDIVFVLNNRINKIHHNCPPADPHDLTPLTYSGIGDHVIEFPGGTCKDFKTGDRVNMYLGTPQNPVQ